MERVSGGVRLQARGKCLISVKIHQIARHGIVGCGVGACINLAKPQELDRMCVGMGHIEDMIGHVIN